MGQVVSHGSYLAWDRAGQGWDTGVPSDVDGERLNCDSCDLVIEMIGASLTCSSILRLEGQEVRREHAACRIEFIGGQCSTDVLRCPFPWTGASVQTWRALEILPRIVGVGPAPNIELCGPLDTPRRSVGPLGVNGSCGDGPTPAWTSTGAAQISHLGAPPLDSRPRLHEGKLCAGTTVMRRATRGERVVRQRPHPCLDFDNHSTVMPTKSGIHQG